MKPFVSTSTVVYTTMSKTEWQSLVMLLPMLPWLNKPSALINGVTNAALNPNPNPDLLLLPPQTVKTNHAPLRIRPSLIPLRIFRPTLQNALSPSPTVPFPKTKRPVEKGLTSAPTVPIQNTVADCPSIAAKEAKVSAISLPLPPPRYPQPSENFQPQAPTRTVSDARISASLTRFTHKLVYLSVSLIGFSRTVQALVDSGATLN